MASTKTNVTQPSLGLVGWLRFLWRQLTSMRTALFLLLILAVAAVPGSVFPQRNIDATRTADWIADRPTLGPWLDRFGFFDVYATPWFASIYLLLFISLVGCVLPRTRVHWDAMRQPPPRTPARLERLAAHRVLEVSDGGAAEASLDDLERALRKRRYRVHRHAPGTLSAEGGYLKETGNLLFHLALIGIIVGVASGHLWGWKGDAIVPEGQTFAKTRFDTFAPGPWVGEDDVPPFTLRLNQFHAEFEREVTGAGQFGMPRDFTAYVTATEDGASREVEVKVNHPLEVDGASVFLLGNGYVPVITVRDPEGNVLYSGATPFLPQDNNYQSIGAIKVPAADPGLGFVGWFLPTAVITEEDGPQSVFPDALQPALALTVYQGELFPDGAPQSVFRLNTEDMTQVTNADGTDAARLWVELGETVEIPGGHGTITLESVDRFAGFSVRHDPGRWLTLAAALLALGGLLLTLLVPRRRVFARVSDGGPADSHEVGRTVVTVAAMAKADDTGLDGLLDDLLSADSDGLQAPPKKDAPR